MWLLRPVGFKSNVHLCQKAPENLNNPEKQKFPKLSGDSTAGQQKWIPDLDSTGQKTIIHISSIKKVPASYPKNTQKIIQNVIQLM